MKSTDSLEKAVQNLETFANQSKSLVSIHVVDLVIKDGKLVPATQSTIKKTFDRLGYLITSSLSSTARHEYDEKSRQVRAILQDDIKLLKENVNLITSLQNGNTEERQFARSILNAISQYNSILDVAEKEPLSSSGYIARFIMGGQDMSIEKGLKAYRIEVPTQLNETVVSNSAGTESDSIDRTVRTCRSQRKVRSLFLEKLTPSSAETTASEDPTSEIELNLLRAKAISEMLTSPKEIGKLLTAIHNKNAPLQADFDEDESISRLRLSVKLPSNQYVDLVATFKRSPMPASSGQSKLLSQMLSFEIIEKNAVA